MSGDLEAILETGSVAAVELAASALAKNGKPTGVCANCANPLIGAYCAVCGQPTDTHRRSVARLAHDIFVDVANLDSRILLTARALLFQPGELSKAFKEGRTQRYVPAFRLYLFVSLIFFLALGVSGIAILQLQVTAIPLAIIHDAKGNAFTPNPTYDPSDPDSPKLIALDAQRAGQPGGLFSYSTSSHFFAPLGAYHSTMSAPARQKLLNQPLPKELDLDRSTKTWFSRHLFDSLTYLAADPAALNGPMTVWIPRALFLLLPIYALLLALFYRRQGKDYYLVDHLVFSLNIHSFAFVTLIIAAALAQLIDGKAVAIILFGDISVYILLAMKRFYGQSWPKTSVKFVLLSATYVTFFLLPALGGILLIGFFGGFLG